MKGKDWAVLNLPLLLVALICIALVVVIQSFRLPGVERQVVVGCVLVGQKEDRGWNENHSIGIMNACRAHNCAFVLREQVAESKDAVSTAVKELVKEGANVIFLTSFGYGAYMDEIAREYSKVAFFGISGNGDANNSITYFTRLYQARYLTGIVAGDASKTGVLGYVASMPNPETLRDINAFTMGMRFVNPKARLIVRFTGSWNNEAEERKSVVLLDEKGADVITFHEDTDFAVQEAEKRGLMSVGYDVVYKKYSERFLTAAINNWKVLYNKMLGDYLSGRINFSNRYWVGFEAEAVALYPLSPLVSEKAVFLVSLEKKRIMNERSVFSGVIYDNQGTLRCEEDEWISDDELFNGLDWLVEGVEIYE
ncbi:MAG: BMP family ABC transporter substrate-binding protein [Fretibacterium sp.]|nr:BMP family ABC transporter substrate-binding protein [Fretibacterium sp.]